MRYSRGAYQPVRTWPRHSPGRHLRRPAPRLPPAPAQASAPPSTRRPYFAQFAPRTALDIVRRVPGFPLDLGDNRHARLRRRRRQCRHQRRSGRAPRPKRWRRSSPRFPASRVVRVEVGPGDLYGAEYSGKSQVLNVILSAEGGIDGNVTASVRPLLHRLSQPRRLGLGADPARHIELQRRPPAPATPRPSKKAPTR